MKKLLITTAILAATSAGMSTTASAALASDATLNFIDGVAGVNSSSDPIVTGGSYFGMDANSNGKITKAERTVLKQNDGMFLGTAQGASGSHGGDPGSVAGEAPGVDQAWKFFNNTGMHGSSSATNVTVTGANTADVDMSGWFVTWNGIPSINMGGGSQDCGTASDGLCVKNNFDAAGNVTGTTDIGGVFNNGSGVGSIVCAVDCATGDTYTLDYTATVPQADPSNFGGVDYALHLEGTIGDAPSAVPVPAAVWLFGSGLLGLVGVARRKVA